jgi:hypothetical protein
MVQVKQQTGTQPAPARQHPLEPDYGAFFQSLAESWRLKRRDQLTFISWPRTAQFAQQPRNWALMELKLRNQSIGWRIALTETLPSCRELLERKAKCRTKIRAEAKAVSIKVAKVVSTKVVSSRAVVDSAPTSRGRSQEKADSRADRTISATTADS